MICNVGALRGAPGRSGADRGRYRKQFPRPGQPIARPGRPEGRPGIKARTNRPSGRPGQPSRRLHHL
eukprot:7824195-Heterocapsa_arctica.AAC.1